MKKKSPIPDVAVAIPWEERNQLYLVRAFTSLRRRLGEAIETNSESADEATASMDPPAAIDALTAAFALSSFERDVLLLLAGVEMDSKLASLCAEIAGRNRRNAVTFSLAMSVLPDPHWSALAPSAPLRRYRLIEMEGNHGLTSAPLRIDERVLHYLAGVNRLDERLDGVLSYRTSPQWMAEEHKRIATELATQFGRLPTTAAVHLCGDDSSAQECIAGFIANELGCELLILRMEDTPAAGAELEQFVALWTRESLLLPAILLLQWESEVPTATARQLAERLHGLLCIASHDSLRLHRPLVRYDVDKPGPEEQKRLWIKTLGAAAGEHPAVVEEIAEQFRFSAETIAAIAHTTEAKATSENAELSSAQLWNACRSHARPKLETMAERIVPNATWNDLVLPVLQLQTLKQLAAQSRHRMMVYETWGFAAKGRRGLGLSALFAGPSGTGKTLAAEVLAHELKLDLYRIDLSAVVSKYIGETEKNLKHVFDAAETGGVLLLFDEADALFGKRAEVKDSHDRYANIEVGYLLQRMESFQGLAILTTNFKSSLDKAFQRRLRFSVDFPFPDATHRESIWKKAFPTATPTSDLEPARLARLNMTGGNIRNIALNAAFLAAESNEPVAMSHLLVAAQLEATKVERPIAEMETRGWV
jgi:ATP-dependent 26S proteasome regulatory subunit